MEEKSKEQLEEEYRLYIYDLLHNVFNDFEPLTDNEDVSLCTSFTSDFLLGLIRSHYSQDLCDGVFLYRYLVGAGYKNVLAEKGNYYYWLMKRK